MTSIVQIAMTMVLAVETAMKSISTPAKRDHWIKLIGKNLRILNKAMKAGENIGVKANIQAAAAKMTGYRILLKGIVVQGAGHGLTRPNWKTWAQNRVQWQDLQTAFTGRIRTGVIVNLTHKDPILFLEDCGPLFVRRIANVLKTEHFLKVNAVFCGKFLKASADIEIEDFKYLNTKNNIIARDTNLSEWFADNIMGAILTQLEEFQESGSGWALSVIVNLVVNINKYMVMLGSSFIPLPDKIKRKNACINVRNTDECCFLWSVISGLHPIDANSHRTSSYPHYTTLNLTNISMPMTIKQIPRFEGQNNLSINLYILNLYNGRYTVVPTYLTKNRQNKHLHILLIQDKYQDEYFDEEEGDDEMPKYHYVWIKNLSALVTSQLTKNDHKKHFCDRCLHYFYSLGQLNEHIAQCQKVNDYKISFPRDLFVTFKNYKHKERCGFIIYSDFESLLKPYNDKKNKNTEKYQHHEAYSVGYYVKCSYDPALSFYRSYRGINPAEWFADELRQFAEDVETVFMCPMPMDQLSADQEAFFRVAPFCHICSKALDAKRVRDHCHFTGKYRGPAHEDCNLAYQDSRTIPVVFHNLSGYDAHLLIKDVAIKIDGNINVIPNNTENYISIIKRIKECEIIFKFLDSFRFMASSLDKLAGYLDKKPILQSEFPDLDSTKLALLTRKGVYPYDYVSSWETLEDTALPSPKQFYNKLGDSHISAADYQHAQNVWKSFNIKTLGQYSDLYMKTDILLLADVFENFRSACMENYDLDAAHYFTASSLSWDAMLKFTKVKLELLSDVDILMFVEKSVRGGLTQCSKRHSKSNNQYMTEYDASKPTTFLMYNDVNAMYAWAMSQYLPHSDIKWVEDINNFNYNVSDTNPIGYVLEVDLEYPEKIHDLHSDLPMAPELRKPPGSKEPKMLASLYNKTNYVIHYRNLKQYVSEGLIVTKIHRVLQFNQSPWLKPYIDLNTKLRAASKNEFEKNLFKLMSNAVFGKTMENVRKHRNLKLVTKWEGRYGAEALISKPNFHARTIFDENLVAIEMLKTDVMFNKPIYVGASILDISKLALYEFHYSYMKVKYGSNCSLCYTDTDSLIYEVRTPDIYSDIRENIDRFDTSDYPQPNPFGIPAKNKKVPGLMKDENNGSIFTEFVGLRAKMYACRVTGAPTVKKAKGVKGYVVKHHITFDDYLECLNNNTEQVHEQNGIRSYKHQLYSETQKKITLSPHDNKRHILSDGVNTLPWGHYSLMIE